METKPDIYEQVSQQNEEVLGYSRKRFLGTWLAIALLAILICLLALTSLRTASTNLDQNEDIARVANKTADEASASTDDITAYLRGEQGIPGVPGANGADGTPGQPSSEPGPEGPKGAKGDARICWYQWRDGFVRSCWPDSVASVPWVRLARLAAMANRVRRVRTAFRAAKAQRVTRVMLEQRENKALLVPQAHKDRLVQRPTLLSRSLPVPMTPTTHKQVSVNCPTGRASGGGYRARAI